MQGIASPVSDVSKKLTFNLSYRAHFTSIHVQWATGKPRIGNTDPPPIICKCGAAYQQWTKYISPSARDLDPHHYSPPRTQAILVWARSPLKSDIVSLRFDFQPSASLSIVGGTERELRLIYGGRGQVAHNIIGPAAVQSSSRGEPGVERTSFQTWVSGSIADGTFNMLFISTIMHLDWCDCSIKSNGLKIGRHQKLLTFLALSATGSSGDAYLIGDLFHASGGMGYFPKVHCRLCFHLQFLQFSIT